MAIYKTILDRFGNGPFLRKNIRETLFCWRAYGIMVGHRGKKTYFSARCCWLVATACDPSPTTRWVPFFGKKRCRKSSLMWWVQGGDCCPPGSLWMCRRWTVGIWLFLQQVRVGQLLYYILRLIVMIISMIIWWLYVCSWMLNNHVVGLTLPSEASIEIKSSNLHQRQVYVTHEAHLSSTTLFGGC